MWRKISSILISLCLIFQQVGFASIATELNLAGHISKMSGGFVADRFRPVHIRFFSYDAQNDNIKVMLDKGDVKSLKENQIGESTKELLNYFLVGINLPNDKFWVNLRPDSENNIIDNYLAKTDVGRIMLEADLQLKKDTAQFTSPATPEGKEYWSKLYQKAEELYGNQEVSIPTLTRPWIVPNEIIVRESKDSAYIYKATLKVMLEQDFLKDSSVYNFKDDRAKALNEYSSELIRELIIPKLTKEVNLSKRYAPLRQVYYSIVLSRWFKSRFSNQTGKYASRIDRKDLAGLTSTAAWSKSTYFDAYKKSFAQGEYNIKETVRTPSGQVIRSYFSGGADFATVKINGGRASSAIEQSLLTAGLIRPEGMKTVSSPVTANKNLELLKNAPQATVGLANRDLTGKNVLIRVVMNVRSEDGVIKDHARLNNIRPIVKFIRSLGGTPILIGHNGRLDTKKNIDDRQSLEDVAKYLQDNVLPDEKVVFHKNSIPKDVDLGLQTKKSDIIQGAVNVLENVRFANPYETGPKKMILARALAALSDGILVFDGAADLNSSGASVETVPFLMNEVYLGPTMMEEFNELAKEIEQGFDAIIMGSGQKADEKIAVLPDLVETLNEGGFVLVGSGPSPTLNTEKKGLLDAMRKGDPEKVITALDYSDEKQYDIGSKTLEKFLAKLDTLKAGQRVLDNGTMGFMEEKSGKYQVGTKAINEKLIELAQRGVRIIIPGGDAGKSAKKYGLDKEKNTATYTSGGVALRFIGNQSLIGLEDIVRRQEQLEIEKSTPADAAVKYNIAINGARGRMGLLYLHSMLYDEDYADLRVTALNGVPLKDLDAFIQKLIKPDSTYGKLFPGLKVDIVEKNEEKGYGILEISGFSNQERDKEGAFIPQRILILNDRKGAISWNKIGSIFGESYLTRLAIIETSGQNLGSAESQKVHLTSVADGMVEFGAPPKDKGTPIVVLSVNEENLDKDAQVFSNASCTTNSIAPVANKIHKAFGVKKGIIETIHSETSDQSAYETFRGDEAARARPGHKLQSPAKTGAAALLGMLIDGIGPNDGKAMRVGTMTGSVVVYTAELERPATVEEARNLFVQANKDESRIFGIGHNIASKDIVKDSHSTIVDLDAIQVSEDGKILKVVTWYDNEWGYAKRGLDTLKKALVKQEEGTRTKDFKAPTPAVKAVKEAKVTPASELEGLASEGALPMYIPALKSATGEKFDLYLTGIKEKQASRYGQIIIRMLMGDPRFNLKAIVVDGITESSFDASMKAFAQSIIYSSDLGNLAGITIIPVLTDKKEMLLVFKVGKVSRSVAVLPNLQEDLDSKAKVIDVTKIKYSYGEMIDNIESSLKPLNAKLLSATISMSTRPGGELLDSGKGTSVPANILPIKISELDKKGMLYQAYEVPVNSGSYLFATFSIKGIVEKDAVHKLLKTIPGLGMEDTTSSHFVANRSNIVLDKSQTLILQDKKDDTTAVGLFFLVNEELNAANKTLEGLAAISASSAVSNQKLKAYSEELKEAANMVLGANGNGLSGSLSALGIVIAYRNDEKAKESREYQRAIKHIDGLLADMGIKARNLNKENISPMSLLALGAQLVMGDAQRQERFAGIIKDNAASNGATSILNRALAQFILAVTRDPYSETQLAQTRDIAKKSGLDSLPGILATAVLGINGDAGAVGLLKAKLASLDIEAVTVSDPAEKTVLTVKKIPILLGLVAIADTESASSAITDNDKKGGIDFRAQALSIKYQPMGNFAGLNPKLPVLSKAELAVFNIDKELSGMEKLVDSQMIPSGDRLKEVLAACSQKGELGANKERLMALMVKIGIVEETQCCLQEASKEYKEALVLADSLA
jgi:glyceraldehyde-3-phosphate dehydrogenase type I